MKKVLCLLLCLAFIFSACGVTEETTLTESGSKEVPTEAVVSSETTEKATTATEETTEETTEEMTFVIKPYEFVGREFAEGEELYEYPEYHPDQDEWRSLPWDKRIETVQIPDELLANMSTRVLALEAANFPYLGDFYAFNSMSAAYETMKGKYNVIAELATREDGGEVAADLLVWFGANAPKHFKSLVFALNNLN